MNVYEWMSAQSDQGPPMQDDDPRENPGNRPHLPEENDDDEMHCTEHTMQDPHMLEDMTSSNESIIEDVRKFFKVHNRGKNFEELDGNAKASAAKIIKTIEHTFASKEWVEKQTPIKGKIKVGDLADRINLDKPVDTIKETAAINDSYQEAVITAQMTVIKQLVPLLNKWNPSKLTDDAYEKTKAALTNIKSMQEIVKKPTRGKTNLVSGKTTDEARETLTPEETIELGSTILGAMKKDHSRILACNEEIHNLLDNFYEVLYEIRHNDAESESYNNAAWDALCEAIARKIPAGIPESMAAFRQFEAACIAAVIYMERSFKGGKGVSVEEFTVSNEGIFDSVKALFKSKPKELEIKHGLDRDHFKEIERTLLNDTWLKQQTLTEGNVTVRFPDAAMKGDYKPLVKRIIQELDKAAQINAKLSEKWFNPIRQGVDLIVSGNIKGANLEQVKSFNETVVYDDLDFDVSYVEPQNFTSDNAEVELPALNIAGIKEAANAIIKLVQASWNYGKTSLGPGAKWPDHTRMHLILDTRGELQSELKKLHNEVESILDYFDEHFYTDQFNYYDLVEGLAVPLLHWIQKSISGVKVANEDFSDLGEKLGGFFRHRPKDLTVEGDHNYQNAKKLIGATFMNDSWLKQQTFSDKPIKVSFPGNLTKFDHSIIDTIRSDSQEHKAKGKQFLDEGFKPVNEVVGYLFAHGWEKDPTHADQLLKSVDFKFHVKHPDVEIAKPSVKQTLPPLDKRSIKKIAQTFLDLVELKKELWDEHLLRIWKIFGVEGKHYEKGGKRYREADATNAPPSVYKMFEKLHKYGEDFEASFYEYNQAYTHILQPTADGLLRWMTHSLTNFKAPK